MKKCSHCDRENMSDAKFCQYCGTDINTKVVQSSIEDTKIDQGFQAPALPENNVFSQNFKNPSSSPPPTNKGLAWLILSSILALTIITVLIFTFSYDFGKLAETFNEFY
ncbi:MAG: zinc ribbon domain-containing protein [Clostridiales bacterium]|nr:zinc ribbon domain-containing protein [Clostridiales bacterium]